MVNRWICVFKDFQLQTCFISGMKFPFGASKMFLYSSGVCVTPTLEPYAHTYCTEQQLSFTQMSNGPWSQKLLATGNAQLANVVYVLSLYITVKVSRGLIIFMQKNHAAHVFLLVVDGQLVTKVLHFRENRNIILGTTGHILSRSS